MASAVDQRRANQRLVETFVEDVWNGTDLDRLEELATPDLVVHHLGASVDRDRDGFGSFHASLLEAVPDLTHQIDQLVVEDDRVAVLVTIAGTPERQIGALAATGESFQAAGFQLYRIDDGRVAELWVLPNAMGMLKDLGIFPDSPGKMLRLIAGALKGRLLGR